MSREGGLSGDCPGGRSIRFGALLILRGCVCQSSLLREGFVGGIVFALTYSTLCGRESQRRHCRCMHPN